MNDFRLNAIVNAAEPLGPAIKRHVPKPVEQANPFSEFESRRLHFDGTAWTEWTGLIDPEVRGQCTPEKISALAMKWLKPCVPADLANDPSARQS